MNNKIAVIGCGNMGKAIIQGICRTGCANVYVANRSAERLVDLQELPCHICQSYKEAVSGAKIVILAIKPQGVDELAKSVKADIDPSAVVVSICAGIPVKALCEAFGTEKIVRVMPNMPAVAGCGMSVICKSESISDEEMQVVAGIFSSIGEIIYLDENLIDIATAVSGSGPAYAFLLLEGMIDCAVRNGLDEQAARLMASQTLMGAAVLALQSSKDIKALTQSICSPAGTTIEAVKVFDECGFQEIVDKAMTACKNRSAEMSGQL